MSKRRIQKSKTLESISGADAIAILKVLADRDNDLAQEIDTVAKTILGQVDVDAIADSVQLELELLQAEDVWDKAGAKREGYVDTEVAAWEIFADALQPFRDEVEKCRKLSMQEAADLTCQGLLKGIYAFDKASETEYKAWAVDIPAEYFGEVLRDWKKIFEKTIPYHQMKEFLATNCPDWSDWSMKTLRSRKS